MRSFGFLFHGTTPERQAALATLKAAMDAGMAPRQVADAVFDAVKKEQFYTFPIPNGPK